MTGHNTVTTTRGGIWSRTTLFLRQVVAELRKVVYPTRPQLINYTVVVLVFVAIMIALVTVLDLAFGEAVRAVLG
jgi:preprotein translocase subunit SecE